MGFFDFLKKKKPEQVIKEISFNNLDKWIENKEKENKEKQEELLKDIKDKINYLIQELEEKIPLLEGIDISEKKVEERAKFIIRENLHKYILHLQRLIIIFKELNEKEPNQLIKKINLTFSDFEKKSHMNYEKATFIVGKEIEGIRDTILNFFRGFNRVTKENKEFLEDLKSFSLIKSNLQEFENIEKTISLMNENIGKINNKAKEIKQKTKNIEDEIMENKNSKEYLEEQQKEQEIGKSRQDLKNQISQLRELIEFKQLSNLFHSNPKEMNIIKEFKSNFQDAFEKDNGKKLLDLIHGTEKQELITEKVSQINDYSEKIKKSEKELKSNEKESILKKEFLIKKLSSEIEDLNLEKFKEEKRQVKMNENKKELMRLIRQELSKLNVNLIFP